MLSSDKAGTCLNNRSELIGQEKPYEIEKAIGVLILCTVAGIRVHD